MQFLKQNVQIIVNLQFVSFIQQPVRRRDHIENKKGDEEIDIIICLR